MLRYRLIATAALLALAVSPAAPAAELSGVAMPDARELSGTRLVLNGVALRTYSILAVRIYVAALYLERRSGDAAQILDSPEKKVLDFHFLRDVGAAAARNAWRESLNDNCRAPCRLPPDELARFLDAVPAVRLGETSSLAFTGPVLEVSVDGKPMGRIDDPVFVRAVLSTFIGAHPSTPGLKRGLLGERE